MNPVLLQLGPLTVHWYGILIVTGAVIAAYICTIEAKRRGEDPDHVWNLLTLRVDLRDHRRPTVSRLLNPRRQFRRLGLLPRTPNRHHRVLERRLSRAGDLRRGGRRCPRVRHLLRVQRLNFSRWLDIATPGILLAQAIGRMGNFINQELYGPATNLPWAFRINPNFPCQEPAGVAHGLRHPGSAERCRTPVVCHQRLSPDLLLRGAVEHPRLARS